MGFDGMCSDVSISGLGDSLGRIKKEIPELAPLMESLEAGRDEELTCQAEGIGPETFYGIIEKLESYPGAEKEVHIGANCALEAVTAANLLRDRVPPAAEAAIDYLGFWSPLTLKRVPEKIPQDFLSRAREISDSEAVSLIIPHSGKRVILSFAGKPPVRCLSPELRRYMEKSVLGYFSESAPDLQIVVGTATTWSAAEGGDFELLERIIAEARKAGTKILFDLGGLGSWSRDALKTYFDILSTADVLSMNESELGVYYETRTGNAPLGTGPAELARMVEAVIRPGQGFLVHTPLFQMATGLEGPVEEALAFAGKTASYRGSTGVFPTAREVAEADLPVSEEGREAIKRIPSSFAAVPGYRVEVTNPVGLGDTWTCSFVLSYLGGLE